MGVCHPILVYFIDDRVSHLSTSSSSSGEQGQVISPLLTNIYLHYVLDVWFEKEVQPRLRGRVYLIRYLDDFVICFQYEADAKKVSEVLPKRFGRYGLELHPDKTRLIAFGRRALEAADKGGKKPETFDFLGFTHICAWSRRGRFTIHVRTVGKRLRRSLLRVSEWCRQHRHDPVDEQCEALNQASGALPVLRTTEEPLGYLAVLSSGAAYLEEMAKPPDAW